MSPAHKSKKKRRNITQSRSKKGVGTRGFERDGFVFASVSCILRSNISVRIYKCYITFGLSFMQIFHPPHTLPKDEMCFFRKRKKSAGVLVAAKRTLLLQLQLFVLYERRSRNYVTAPGSGGRKSSRKCQTIQPGQLDQQRKRHWSKQEKP